VIGYKVARQFESHSLRQRVWLLRQSPENSAKWRVGESSEAQVIAVNVSIERRRLKRRARTVALPCPMQPCGCRPIVMTERQAVLYMFRYMLEIRGAVIRNLRMEIEGFHLYAPREVRAKVEKFIERERLNEGL
jgi:hypothetical protein